MPPLNFNSEAGIALAIGGAALALSQSDDLVRILSPNFPLWPFLSLFAVGVLCVLIGLLGLLLLWLRSLHDRLDPRYECYRAKRNDLKQIYDFCLPLLGDEISDLKQMKRMFDRNPTIFWVVRRVKPRPFALVGCFSIVPLTHPAIELVETESITASDFEPKHIARPRARTTAVYIGGVAARGARNKGITLHHLQGQIARESGQGVTTVYARPVTRDGLRLVRKYEFLGVTGRREYEIGRTYRRVFEAGE